MIPTALPGVGIPCPRRVPEEMRILGEGAAPLPLLTATAGLVLASLPPPSSTAKMTLQRRDLEIMGFGALLGEGHGLAAGHSIGRHLDATLGTFQRVLGCEERGEDALWKSSWSRGISGYL